MNDGFLLLLSAKMVVAATCVVLASLVAERTGPLIAAMVATLPVSAGPIYVFLALEHDDVFISDAALASMGSNTATTAYALAYVFAAQRWRTIPALLAAFASWACTLLVFKTLAPSFLAMITLTFPLFLMAHTLVKPYLKAAKPGRSPRPWFALPLRAAGVAALVAFVTTISTWAGSQWTGLFATFPVVLTSLVVILHPNIGGPATAAMIGSCVLGLLGFSVALGAAHALAIPLGKWAALAAGLAICLAWNLVLALRARR